MLGGWDHSATLSAMRIAPGLEDSRELDRFDFAVRQQVPNSGLEALREMGAPENAMARLVEIEEWRALKLNARDWAARVNGWARSELVAEALDEAAEALDAVAEIGIDEYWRAVKAVLRLKPLRTKDGRRNVVYVLSAHEARQWVLPVVFVCGMVEKHFPQFHRQDPFFPDATRRSLNANGVRVRTAEQFERDERALFESAVTRGTISVTLTLPEFDARGDRNLPSLFVENFLLPIESARPVRPLARGIPVASAWVSETPARLDYVREKTARVSPTALESFLQCPFQYYAGRFLRLLGAPGRPEERLDFLTQGGIVHKVLATWWNERQDIGNLFEEVFAREAEEKHIPISYQTERARNAMLDDLRKFEANDSWPRGEYESRTELEFEFPLNESVAIRGKIDRLDVGRDGRAVVIDYKYSNAQRTKAKLENENLLQAPLYLMAAERSFGFTPGGMYYVGIKGSLEYAQWEAAGAWAEKATERTLRVVEEIRGGRVEVSPADTDNCRFCDVRDICRVETRQAVAIAESA
jgi:ATP-dependent helicase/DNAse subunit B